MNPHPKELLESERALAAPDFRKLNEHNGRNDRLLHAVLAAYAKHNLDSERIGWNRLGEILHNAIVAEIGREEFLRWVSRLNKDI